MSKRRILTNLDYIELESKAVKDWNQNDETAADYIKNRPFYENIISVEALSERTISGEVQLTEDDASVISEILTLGNTLKVIFDGQEYLCEVYDIWNGRLAIGNGSLWGEDGGNGEPFLIYYYYAWYIKCETDGDHTISVYTIDGEIITLDEKYIPDTLKGKMSISNPVGGGSFSMNRAESTIGDSSATLGYLCIASGDFSMASGHHSEANGMRSYAEGYCTIANGYISHAEGSNTLASSDYQHVQGKYNVEDADNKYAHIVGNGTASDTLSNAHTLDWEGNAWFAGDVYIGGSSQDDTNAKKLATEDYVNEKCSGGESTSMSHVYAAIMDTGSEYTLQMIDGSESFSPEEPFLQGGKDIYVWNPNSGKTSKVLALNIPGNNTYEMAYIDASEGNIKVLIYDITEKTISLKIS